ncbi:lipoprotein, partial [Pseudomonas syringae pv. actinidiae ICMP 18807]
MQYQPDDPRLRSDLTEQRIRQSIGEQLDQRGLRMA